MTSTTMHFEQIASIRPDGRTPLAVSGYYAVAFATAPDVIPGGWTVVATHRFDRDGCVTEYATPHGAVLLTGSVAYLLA